MFYTNKPTTKYTYRSSIYGFHVKMGRRIMNP